MTVTLDLPVILRLFAPNAPAPEAEYRFHPKRRYRFDYAWPARQLAVEIDGGQHAHRGGRHNTDDDRWKMSEAAALGYRVLRFSPDMLRDEPERCAQLIAQALEAA